MIKFEYKAEPFYTDFGLNEPKKDLLVEFNEDSTSTEIIAELLKLLTYAGYRTFTREGLEEVIEDLVCDGVIEEEED